MASKRTGKSHPRSSARDGSSNQSVPTEPSAENGEGAEKEGGGARSFWSGTITFGLVSVPVSLFSAYRSTRTSMRMLAPDHTPLSRRYFCPAEQRPIDSEEIVRGYETDEGKFIVVTDEELEALEPRKTRDIELKRFVDAGTIPPLYFEHAYWLVPDGNSFRAYYLLARVMEQGNKAGIASFVMRGKEHVVAIIADRGLLRAETLRFADELRSPEQIGLPAAEPANGALVRALRRAIEENKHDDLDVASLKDDYSDRLAALVEKKRAEKDRVVQLKSEDAAAPEGGEVIDLMEVLKRSLAQVGRGSEAAANEAEAGESSRSAETKRKPTARKPASQSASSASRSSVAKAGKAKSGTGESKRVAGKSSASGKAKRPPIKTRSAATKSKSAATRTTRRTKSANGKSAQGAPVKSKSRSGSQGKSAHA